MAKPNAEPPAAPSDGRLGQEETEHTASLLRQRYRTVLFQAALFSAVAVFAALTVVVRTGPIFLIDVQITHGIQSIDSPLFAALMKVISWPGFLPQSAIITLLVAFILYLSRLHWESAVSLLASLFSWSTNELVKTLIRRPRPSVELVDVLAVLESFSFPSGHVMFYTILFGFVWYLVYALFKPSFPRSLLLGILSIFILGVGLSRIYLGQHWASDVLGAYLLGGLMLAGTIWLYRRGKTRFFIQQPAALPEAKEE